jgi:dynein heavy chain
VQRKKFRAIRSEVKKQLFAVRPTFAGALQQIKAAVAELSSVSFAHANPNHTYMLAEYGELQAATREQKAKPALDGAVDKIQKVGLLCTAVTSTVPVMSGSHRAAIGSAQQCTQHEQSLHPMHTGCALSMLVQVLEKLCKDVQTQAVLYQESVRDASELEDTTGVELYPAASGSKARPMVVIKKVRA